jgi:hypothetical protein
MHNTLVIVGSGFCGTVPAVNLLRRPRAVPAARLSADSRDPLQFLSFAQHHVSDADGEDFLPRSRPAGHAYASFSIPASRRFTSSRVLYMEMPVRSSPPRSANPSTCTGRDA